MSYGVIPQQKVTRKRLLQQYRPKPDIQLLHNDTAIELFQCSSDIEDGPLVGLLPKG